MKNFIIKTVVILSVILSVSQAAKAQDFAVSCTIPAIPGVNAPFIQEERVVTNQPSSAAESTIPSSAQNNSPEETTAQIQQEDSKENVLLAKNAIHTVVQTLYSR
jgi:hypothetical protein